MLHEVPATGAFVGNVGHGSRLCVELPAGGAVAGRRARDRLGIRDEAGVEAVGAGNLLWRAPGAADFVGDEHLRVAGGVAGVSRGGAVARRRARYPCDPFLIDRRDAGDRYVDGVDLAPLAVRLIGHERVEADRGVLIETAGGAGARRGAGDGQGLRAAAAVEGAGTGYLDGLPPGAVFLAGDERLLGAGGGEVGPAHGAVSWRGARHGEAG